MEVKDKKITKNNMTLVGNVLEKGDSKAIANFLEQSNQVIVDSTIDCVTGIITEDKKEVIYSLARILKASLKGKGIKQVCKEIKILKDKNKIKGDFADSINGFKSFIDLLNFIDSENPDEEKLKAVSAMFYFLNSTNIKDEGEKFLAYKLFQIVKELNASQLLILKALYEISKENTGKELAERKMNYTDSWFHNVAEKVGHNIPELVEIEEQKLMDNGIVSKRMPNPANVSISNARLTTLGIKLYEKLQEYNFENLNK